MNAVMEKIQQGVQAHLQGDITAAALAYQNALELDNDNATAHNNLGFILGQQQHWHDAVIHLERALELNSHMAMAHSNLGQVLIALGESDRAMHHLIKATHLEPTNSQVWANLGRIRLLQNDTSGAESAYRQALINSPEDIHIITRLGTSIAAQKRYAEAIDIFSEATHLNPNYAEAWVQMGVTLFLRQDYGSAKDALKKALFIKPDDYNAAKHLALICASSGAPEEAIEILQTLCRQQPNDHALSVELAVLELSVKKILPALERLSIVYETEKNNSRVQFYYALALQQQGNELETAKAILKEITVKQDSYSAKALEVLNKYFGENNLH